MLFHGLGNGTYAARPPRLSSRISYDCWTHTKFEFDHLFALTAKAYASADVFTTEELAAKQASCRHHH